MLRSAEEREQGAQALADAFARLDVVRAWIVVGGLLPVLCARPLIASLRT